MTDRERKVLELIADGKSSKGIARIIEMSVKVVDARQRRIMQKLGITNKWIMIITKLGQRIIEFEAFHFLCWKEFIDESISFGVL